MQFLVLILLCLAGSAAASANIDVFVEGLYWYTSEPSDWAFTLVSSGSSIKADYKTFSFDWAPGIRGGLRYRMDGIPYDMRLYYTGISSEASGKTKGSVTPAFMASRLSLLEPFSSGKARLNIDYNMFDWELGAFLEASSSLVFRPAIGIKGGWINQRIHSDWARTVFSVPIMFKENLRQHFQGVGPKGAASFIWSFEKLRLQLLGLFDVSHLWGHWAIKDRFIDSLETEIFVKTDDRNFGSLVLHSFIGLEWDCEAIPFKLKFGYEIETWFNQLQIFTDDSGSQNNNLVFQGVTFGAAVNF